MKLIRAAAGQAEEVMIVGHDANLLRKMDSTNEALPHMTLSGELQQLRIAGVLELVDDRGSTDWLVG